MPENGNVNERLYASKVMQGEFKRVINIRFSPKLCSIEFLAIITIFHEKYFNE